MNTAVQLNTGYTSKAYNAQPFLWEYIESNNDYIKPDEYEYTDEDAIKDTQPFYHAYEGILRNKSEDNTIPECAELYDDTDDEERYEAGLRSRADYYPEDYDALMRDMMNMIDEQRDSSGLYPEYNYSYGNSRDEADYLFDNLDENRTPEGWPDTFYKY